MAPTVHNLLHEAANEYVSFERHSSSDQVNFDIECNRPHAPERPCIFCTQLSVHVGMLADDVPVWLDTRSLVIPDVQLDRQLVARRWDIRGPPALG
ncbi:MAG: hypothetical protein R2834_09560 [Rhodothermales bacterium]